MATIEELKAAARKDSDRKYYLTHKEKWRERHLAHREQRREYSKQNRLKHLEHLREVKRNYYQSHKTTLQKYAATTPAIKVKAKNTVRTAIARGELIPLTTCQQCGAVPEPTINGRRAIQAHHYLGYEPEHWLDVQWLCISCHQQADRLRREQYGNK